MLTWLKNLADDFITNHYEMNHYFTEVLHYKGNGQDANMLSSSNCDGRSATVSIVLNVAEIAIKMEMQQPKTESLSTSFWTKQRDEGMLVKVYDR